MLERIGVGILPSSQDERKMLRCTCKRRGRRENNLDDRPSTDLGNALNEGEQTQHVPTGVETVGILPETVVRAVSLGGDDCCDRTLLIVGQFSK